VHPSVKEDQLIVNSSIDSPERSTLRINDDDVQDKSRAITESASDLAGRFELQPLLESVLRHATSLLGCESGSISLVDEQRGTYTKRVDFGVGCQEGQTFSLDQGVTGEVVRSRGTVILDAYSDIPEGHIEPGDPRWDCAVVGVPIRWADKIIGSCVIFSDRTGRIFSPADVKLVELFASHAAIALANAELHAKATEREREAAVALERERAVRDVHETVGRSLSTLLESLAEAEKAIDQGHPAWKHIERVRTEATEALSEARRTAMGLGPASLEGRTLEEALRLELDWVQSVSSAETQVSVVGTSRSLSPEVAHAAFRITQEALSNVVSHARATRVRVGLVYGTRSVTVLVEDNGRGFAVPGTQTFEGFLSAGSLGLHGMTSRALHLGGDLRLESIPGWGTKVLAILPDRPDALDSPSLQPWKVLISNSQPLLTAGLVRLLQEHEPSMQIATDAVTLDELFEATAQLVPDVVVLDLDMVGKSMTEVVERIRAENPNAALVLYTEHPTIEQIRLSKQLGVRGYLNKKSTKDTIVRTIIAAGQGQALVEGDLFDHLTDSSSGDSNAERLTARELEVRELVAKGLADKQVATVLSISVKTVEKHVGSLLRKTGARNRTMLTSMGDDRAPI
jgi:signal transduction histidine kinase/DNA-binding NarL/FixJ family response regulator